jgi:hypothetical protein
MGEVNEGGSLRPCSLTFRSWNFGGQTIERVKDKFVGRPPLTPALSRWEREKRSQRIRPYESPPRLLWAASQAGIFLFLLPIEGRRKEKIPFPSLEILRRILGENHLRPRYFNVASVRDCT